MMFLTTPSHGYLVVPKDKFFPVYEQMTSEQQNKYGYGYADFNNVYLEEDCEASEYIKMTGIKLGEIEDHYTESFDVARNGNMIFNHQPLYHLSEVLNQS